MTIRMVQKMLSEVPDGQLFYLEDGTLATTSGEQIGFRVVTEVTVQHAQDAGFQRFLDGYTRVYLPEWENE